jgi:hypothetical protein
MIYARSRRFIFIHLHKTGGTSFEQGYEPFARWDDLILGSTPHGEQASTYFQRRFGLYKHSGLDEIEAAMGRDALEGMRILAFVRHPRARVASLYNFVGGIVLGWAEKNGTTLPAIRADWAALSAQHGQLRWPASRAFIESEDFGGFIRNRHLHYDAAFRSQAAKTRTETLVAEPLRIEDMAGSTVLQDLVDPAFVLPHANRSHRILIRSADITPADAAFLADHFRDDMAAFGYD